MKMMFDQEKKARGQSAILQLATFFLSPGLY
jgi:hypothetical protein